MTIRKNLKITGIANLIAFVLGFASVLIVSRILTPTEIGIFSVSVAVLGLAHIFRDFGVNNYLVQAADVGKQQFRAAFSITLYTSWLIASVLYLSRNVLATLYGHQGVSEILSLLSINFLILPFGAPLLSLMRRDMQFDKLALCMIFSTLIQTSVTVGCALAGEGYLSMAWGAVAAHLCKMILLNFLRPGEIFMLPTMKGLGEVFRFGSVSSLTSIIKELGSSSPDLILGRTLGFVEIAYFSRAIGLKKMLIERLINLVRGVHFPTFASELRKGENPANLYAKAMLYMVSITIPVLAFLAIISEPLIIFLFGDQWERSAWLATLICSYSILTAPYSLYGLSLIAAGKVNLTLKAELIVFCTKILILLTSLWLTLEDVVALLGVAFLIEAIVSQLTLRRAFGLTFSKLLSAIKPSLLLLPLSLAGPTLVIYFSNVFEYREFRFVILLSSSLLAAIGWLTSIYLTNHLMKVEVNSIVQTIKVSLSKNFASKA